MISFNKKYQAEFYSSAEKSKISEAISIAAHQLRHPVAVIKSFLEALSSEDIGKLNVKQREYIDDALENIKRISATIEHFLDVSIIEEGRYELKLEPVSLTEIVESELKDFAIWAEASNCEIIFQRPREILPTVLADSLKIRQVVENLISNAIKYQKAGRGRVEISVEKKGKEIVFSCKDNGIGIPRGDTKKVFTKFYRSEEAMEIDPSGSGLGLYLNKATIEVCRGKIWFSRNRAFGTTFFFSLPIFAASLFVSQKSE